MIAANEAVARHMRDAKAPMVYRIHEDPDPEALAQIALVLKEFDYPIKDIHGASPATFQRIIAFAHGRKEKYLINSLLVRSLERARYVDFLSPHFGLASEAYCHFTSPIRRYPDLIVHRLLKAQLRGALDTDRDAVRMTPELAWLAEHSSQMEREAAMAEMDSVRFKLCELMAEHIDEVFDGIVTGCRQLRSVRPARQHRRGTRALRGDAGRALPLRAGASPARGRQARRHLPARARA